MKTRTEVKTLTARDSHLLPYAKTLVKCAENDPDFANILTGKVNDRNFGFEINDTRVTSSPISITEQIEANKILDWLLAECDQHTPYSTGLLVAFAESHKSPKSFVVMGLGMTVVPGLTIGNPSIKKRHKGQLQVFISKAFAENTEAERLAELITEEGQSVLARELKIAGGTITRLHPDSAEWLMSDPATKVSVTEENILADIAKVIESEKLSGLVKRNENSIQMIAVSPAVPDSVAEDLV